MKKLEIRINSSFLMYPSVEKGGYFLFFDFFQENTLFCYRIIPPFYVRKYPFLLQDNTPFYFSLITKTKGSEWLSLILFYLLFINAFAISFSFFLFYRPSRTLIIFLISSFIFFIFNYVSWLHI